MSKLDNQETSIIDISDEDIKLEHPGCFSVLHNGRMFGYFTTREGAKAYLKVLIESDKRIWEAQHEQE